MLRALVGLGRGRKAAISRGYERLADRILDADGVPCMVMDWHGLMNRCRMTLPQTLRSLAAVPSSAESERTAELRRLLVEKLLEIRVWRYVRPDARHFYDEVVPLRPEGTTFRQWKAEYRSQHPGFSPEELEPKPGWLHFQFPSHYNTDLLEAMLALAEAEVDHHPAMDEALDKIEEKRLPDGRWALDKSLNGKMLSRVEARGRPSKWVTLRALRVLTRFGRMEL